MRFGPGSRVHFQRLVDVDWLTVSILWAVADFLPRNACRIVFEKECGMGSPIRRLTMLLLSLLLLPVPASASWFGDLALSLSHDDNLNRAALSDDERPDTFVDAELAWVRPFDLREHGVLDAGVGVSARLHDSFDDLNAFSLNVGLNYHRRFGLGPQALWLGGHLDYQYISVNDEWREGNRQSFGLSIGRGWGEAWQVSAGVAYSRQSPDNVDQTEGNAPYNVFRLSEYTLNLDLDYALNNGWLLLGGLDYLDGQINSSTTDPDLFEGESTPWVDDPVFGPDFRTYRLDATAMSYRLGLSIPTGKRASINLLARFTDVDAANDISYGATQWQLSYLREL
jgi:opacity protein-like surface antigen